VVVDQKMLRRHFGTKNPDSVIGVEISLGTDIAKNVETCERVRANVLHSRQPPGQNDSFGGYEAIQE